MHWPLGVTYRSAITVAVGFCERVEKPQPVSGMLGGFVVHSHSTSATPSFQTIFNGAPGVQASPHLLTQLRDSSRHFTLAPKGSSKQVQHVSMPVTGDGKDRDTEQQKKHGAGADPSTVLQPASNGAIHAFHLLSST